MEARELRIGNLLKHKDGFIMEIDSINELEVRGNELGKNDPDNEIEASLIDLSGIPLTEEWILKFGFYKGKYKNVKNNHWCYNVLLYDKDGINIVSSDEQIIFLSKCKYAHQLQNLSYCLTGEELELKETVKHTPNS